MDINKFLSKLFGNKSTRDMKLIQPLVETVKKAYPEIQALSNDALRAKTQEVKKYVQSSADDLKAKIAELKAKVEEMPIEDRSSLFSQIDKLEKDVLERYEQALNEVMPVVFSIVKSTAERFAISTASWRQSSISWTLRATRRITTTIGRPEETIRCGI